ncbi:MAG: SRPBCC family protein [Bacteroidota bacterium]
MPKLYVEKSIEIKAPAAKVFSTLNDFSTWTAWSPWLIMEPEAKVTVSDDKKSYKWEGKKVGSGEMKITGEEIDKTLYIDLTFLTPYKSHAKVWLDLESDGDSTKVTWFLDSSLPFFMFWMKKMMEAFLGMDYLRGLFMLKDYVEDGEVHSKMEFTGTGNYPGCKYVGVKSECKISDISASMERDFAKLGAFMDQHKDLINGNAVAIYHKWELVKGMTTYTVGFPVKSLPENLAEGIIIGEIPSTPVYKLTHKGPYRHLGNAWSTMQNLQRNKIFKMNKKIDPFESYVNMPGEVPDNELTTEVIFATK